MAYEHPATSDILQNAFKSALPYSISLAYRTQHSNQTKDAHILATFPPTSNTVPECWAAAYIDRSMRPETELWIFAAGEIPNHKSGSQKDQFCSGCRKSVLSLLKYMSTLPVPPLHPESQPALELAKHHEKEHPKPGPDGSYGMSPGTYMRHLLLPSVVTLGACHNDVVQICHEAGVLRTEFPGPNAELNKFLFKISELPQTKDLPEGLRWGEMREEDIAMVQSRTSIPRSTRTLLSLKNVGVFDEVTNRPVAWTFLGLDGSLVTLHTEPEYRGKGIAKAVATKIIKEHASDLAVDKNGNAWSHADVYLDNVQSESVCMSLGGKALWRHLWVRIDFAKAKML